MLTTKRYTSATVVALATTLVLSSFANAAPPLTSRTQVRTQRGEISLNDGTFYFYFSTQQIRSSEVNNKESVEIIWNYYNFVTNTSGSGFCTIAGSTLNGTVLAKGGTLSLKVDTTPLLVGVDCLYKNGGNLMAAIDWASDGFHMYYFDGITKEVSSYPGASTLTSTYHGKANSMSADARVNIVNVDLGTVIGTLGYPDGTLAGIATLEKREDTSQTIEKTPPGGS